MSTVAESVVSDDLTPFESFEFVRTEEVQSLNLTMVEYRHRKTGAVHYHLATDNDENVFLVALRTVPTDSSGVAHILEHTSLCGSERYPVRDPFFMMIRRSLNTFMNAFTSSDWTAYPFASQNSKDFKNLLDVYLDAVFLARLDSLDFAQEGHRLEFETADDASSNLVYKGVVFNEMKGAMSSPVSAVYDLLNRYLFPTNTYHFNSGGDPACIPDLSYDELTSFYKTHYHPSNAVFMTYGNMLPRDHQQTFEDRALSRFDALGVDISVPDEKRYLSPVKVEESYAIDLQDESETLENKTHHVIAWLLGHSTDIEERLRLQLLSDVLMDNSASPLMLALETTDLGTSPSRLCGLEDGNREMSFMCGIEGSNPEQVDAFEALVIETLEKVVKDGVPQENVEAMLHQLELSQREVGGGGYPYGLQLILAGLSTAIHRGDPVASLNIDPVLEKLREEIKDRQFIPRLIQTLILDNQHRVLLTVKPDPELNQKRKQAEEAQLQSIKDNLSEAESAEIISLTQKLADRQEEQDDESILPKVGLEDVPATLDVAKGEEKQLLGSKASFYPQGTNGIVYQQVVFQMPALEPELLNVLPFYTRFVTELGIAGKSYLEVQAIQAQCTGGLSAYSAIRGAIDNEQDVSGNVVFSTKALVSNVEPMAKLLWQTIQQVEFNEYDRISELVAQQRSQMDQSITGGGHGLAMLAASAGMSPAAALGHHTTGLEGIKLLRDLDDSFRDKDAGAENIKAFTDKLMTLHGKVIRSEKQFLVVGEQEHFNTCEQVLAQQWAKSESQEVGPAFSLPSIRDKVEQMWVTSTQVNFCARVYPTVAVEHPDSAALTVLGGYLRNGYLHTSIREKGGAYGGGAMQDSAGACFKFFSYRDPRMSETLKDFDQSIDWLLSESHEPRLLEEAILGVVSDIDKPSSPAGEAKTAFHNNLSGRTEEQRRRFRLNILNVSQEDLIRVGKTYFSKEAASTAIITNKSTHESEGDLGLQVISL
ncbi:MAG: peptidase M16 [Gammaproteobacteria bacterium]|nr:MAG: peptidase M16 [Gammaproteobacteria bacterium]